MARKPKPCPYRPREDLAKAGTILLKQGRPVPVRRRFHKNNIVLTRRRTLAKIKPRLIFQRRLSLAAECRDEHVIDQILPQIGPSGCLADARPTHHKLGSFESFFRTSGPGG
jgi:hypothetical protein